MLFPKCLCHLRGELGRVYGAGLGEGQSCCVSGILRKDERANENWQKLRTGKLKEIEFLVSYGVGKSLSLRGPPMWPSSSMGHFLIPPTTDTSHF